jgi:hypothetical protein
VSSTKPSDPPLWLEVSVGRLRLLIGKDEDEQKRGLYEALLHIGWLPSRFRGAILRELGSSLRQQQQGYAKGYALIRRHLIKEAKARLRKQGERRRGGIHDAAVDEVAKRFGVKPGTLKKQLQRQKNKQQRHK